MINCFIPDSFEVPETFVSEHFYLKVLDENIAELDFEAVVSSRKRLQGIFGPKSAWPKDNMTLKDNIDSLKVHKQEFESKDAFAYSVFNSTNEKCLGSVYIDPSRSSNYDCEVYLWIRDDSIVLDKLLYRTMLNWLQVDWPFSKVAFPGRCISWKNWENALKAV
ncbi:hypothetical protein [Cognaticolwellia mytili]|uniref:hypothetical protein n=1 Tax=Cognaticolwellia mytili TaxID=1888913 RepID=UPI000A1783FE|nr:hypothetical protein [Cognaticolwellia mytili]